MTATVWDHTALLTKTLEEAGITEVKTRTLPFTTRVVPARVALGKVKRTRLTTHSREADYSYSAEVIIDGTLAGWAEDEGYGGGFQFHPANADGRKAEDILQAESWLLAGKPSSFFLHEELWSDLIEEHEAVSRAKRSKKTPVLTVEHPSPLVDDDFGDGSATFKTVAYMEISVPLATVLTDAERVKASGVLKVWNGTEWQSL